MPFMMVACEAAWFSLPILKARKAPGKRIHASDTPGDEHVSGFSPCCKSGFTMGLCSEKGAGARVVRKGAIVEMPTEILVDAAVSLPVETLVVVAWTKMLDIRREELFWVVCLTCVVCMACLRYVVDPFARAAVDAFALILFYLGIPMLFSRGSVVSRVMTCITVFVASIAALLIAVAMWVTTSGASLTSMEAISDHFVSYWFTRCAHLALLAVLLVLLHRFVASRRDIEASSASGLFVGFAATQLALLLTISAVGDHLANCGLESDGLTLFLLSGGSVLSVLCICIDAVLFAVIDRYDRRMAEERYLRALERQLEWRMRRYDDMAAEMESIARVRHDLRNQLQVVTILARKGERAAAREHLRSMVELTESVLGEGGSHG